MLNPDLENCRYPQFLKKFSELFIKLNAPSKEDILSNIAWNFAFFSHLVKRQKFILALPYLETIGLELTKLHTFTAPTNEILDKLIRFIHHLKIQYEKFLHTKALL